MVTVWENSAAAVLGGSFAVFSVGVGYQFTVYISDYQYISILYK